MTKKDLIEYFNQFDNGEISFIIANPSEDVRKIYPPKEIMVLEGMGKPCFLIEVGKGKNLDEENIMHTTLDDQISIDDYIGG